MPRHKAILELPPLQRAFPDFNGFPGGGNRKRLLLEKLHGVAESLRKKKPQIFYSMREVGEFFDVPLRTVALVYKALEKEGMLNRIWGSHTMLAGRENTPRFSVRGIVGIPIWSEMMILSSFTRRINMELEERLRHQGFVADLIFHSSKREETQPDFSERLLGHQLDVVFWQNPDPRSRQNILSLRNCGVRILAIQTTEAQTDLPVLTYLQDWRPAYRKLGRHWKANGIQKVLLPMNAANLAYSLETGIFTSLMEESGLRVEICRNDPAETLRKCRTGSRRQRVAIGFLEMLTADRFCNHEPLLMEKIARIAPFAFCRGPLRAPYLQNRGIHPDVVSFSPSEVAARIAKEIQILPGLPDEVRHTFDAHFWAREDFDNAVGLS